eukprot:12899805-Prorocentrum_lima.AAC.1
MQDCKHETEAKKGRDNHNDTEASIGILRILLREHLFEAGTMLCKCLSGLRDAASLGKDCTELLGRQAWRGSLLPML